MFEIAAFLRAFPGDVATFLRQRRLLRRLTRGTGRKAVLVTSARGVAQAVSHFRAQQGAEYQRGKDPLRELDLNVAGQRRRKALRLRSG